MRTEVSLDRVQAATRFLAPTRRLPRDNAHSTIRSTAGAPRGPVGRKLRTCRKRRNHSGTLKKEFRLVLLRNKSCEIASLLQNEGLDIVVGFRILKQYGYFTTVYHLYML